MAIQDDYAYVGGQYGFSILDMSDLSRIKETSFLNLPLSDVQIMGRYAYVVSNDMHIIDVSDPMHPLATSMYSIASEQAGLIALHTYNDRQYALLVMPQKGMLIIDVSIPTSPTESASYELNAWINDLVVLCDDAGRVYAYLATPKGIHVIDISQPEKPEKITFLSLEWCDRIFVQEKYVYAATQNGLFVLDISSLEQPVIVGQYSGIGQDVVGVGSKYVFIAEPGGGLSILDVSNPSHIVNVETLPFYFDPFSFAHNLVQISKNYVYVLHQKGLSVLDATDPVKPIEVGFYDTLSAAMNLASLDDYVYIVQAADYNSQTYWGWLSVVDVSQPMRPTNSTIHDLYQPAYNIVMSDRYAYVPQGHCSFGGAYCLGSVTVFDLSHPPDLVELANIEALNAFAPHLAQSFQASHSWFVSDLALDDKYAYVAGFPYPYPGSNSGGIEVLEMSEGVTPTSISVITSGNASLIWTPNSVVVDDSEKYLYVADYDYGLRVFDISIPYSPTQIGTFEAPESIDVVISEHYAFIARGTKGILILDISDPSTPQKVKYYSTPGQAQQITIHRSYAYVATLDRGLLVLDISNPAQPVKSHYYNTPMATGTKVVGEYIFLVDSFGGLFVFKTASQD